MSSELYYTRRTVQWQGEIALRLAGKALRKQNSRSQDTWNRVTPMGSHFFRSELLMEPSTVYPVCAAKIRDLFYSHLFFRFISHEVEKGLRQKARTLDSSGAPGAIRTRDPRFRSSNRKNHHFRYVHRAHKINILEMLCFNIFHKKHTFFLPIPD